MSAIRRSLTVLLLAASSAQAQTALDECTRRVARQADMAGCLLVAQRAASDDLLAAFQKLMADAERLERATGRGGATDQLTASQRDFERYVDGQCRLVHALYASGNGADQAALACEIDLLRQRTAALRALLPAAR